MNSSNKKIRAVIADDEPLARDALRVLLKKDSRVEIVAECRNGEEAIAAVRRHSPDLIFLDVQMPGTDGFQVVEQIGVEKMPVTIFVTAFDKYALRAFTAHALDYLLKPFDHERFETALERAIEQIQRQNFVRTGEKLFALLEDLRGDSTEKIVEENPNRASGENEGEFLERFVIKSQGRIYFVKAGEVEWIEAMGDYASLRVGDKSHLLHRTMKDLQRKLDPKKFVRIHRSIILNIEFIKDVQPLFKGEYIITLTSGKQLKSSRGFHQQLQVLFDETR